ncbi:spore germination protein [Bacillus salacetis]|uniref:spore germination protein n=1 Tax=Bacillus salacetis TaxID=2315464 RepID=UPI003BA30526
MSCYIKNVFIHQISGGEVTFGAPFNQSPVSSTKSMTGSGSGNTGPFQITTNGVSFTSSIPQNSNL